MTSDQLQTWEAKDASLFTLCRWHHFNYPSASDVEWNVLIFSQINGRLYPPSSERSHIERSSERKQSGGKQPYEPGCRLPSDYFHSKKTKVDGMSIRSRALSKSGGCISQLPEHRPGLLGNPGCRLQLGHARKSAIKGTPLLLQRCQGNVQK